ncbi:MAG: methyltransferase domain-containing protein [Desulfobacterales bacterium]
MRIDTKEYGQYLEKKYLPGRRLYLNYFIYPKYLKEFKYRLEMGIYDFGCGNGEFLKYCKKKGIKATGIDSNYSIIEECQKKGLNVIHDNIVNFSKPGAKINNAICDNVIEHLTFKEIYKYFRNLKNLMSKEGILLIIVPGVKGYQKDPTHKTFLNSELIKKLCLDFNIKINKNFFIPLNFSTCGNILYLNMAVYKLVF